jgi:hypothetical protein
MKKYLLLSGLCIAGLALSAPAQKPLYIGIKGGLSIPSLRAGESENDWNKNYVSRRGPYFGAFAEIPLSRFFSFQPEIAYAAEGGKRNGIQPMGIPAQYLALFQGAFKTDNAYIFADLNTTSRVNYIQVPLLLKFTYPVTHNGKLKIFAQAGPYLGYLVAAKQIVKTSDLHVYLDGQGFLQIPPGLVHAFFGNSVDTVIDAKNDLHKFNAGVQAALGVSYDIGLGKIFAEGGGNYGFMYIQKGDEHGKNNIGAGTILFGYAYNIRKKKNAAPSTE